MFALSKVIKGTHNFSNTGLKIVRTLYLLQIRFCPKCGECFQIFDNADRILSCVRLLSYKPAGIAKCCTHPILYTKSKEKMELNWTAKTHGLLVTLFSCSAEIVVVKYCRTLERLQIRLSPRLPFTTASFTYVYPPNFPSS